MESREVLLVEIGDEECFVTQALAEIPKCRTTALDANSALKWVASKPDAIAAIVIGFIDPTEDGDSLERFRRMAPRTPLIATSAGATSAVVMAALRNGATDFVCSPATAEEWQRAINTAANDSAQTEVSSERAPLIPGFVVGKSPAMAAIAAALPQVAWSDAPVLIQGETGSGKEVLARALHGESPRAKKPFFKLNCAALPSELIESELFGYERGAFTGAFQRKPGIFEAADGGTLLLDEIGDMDVRLQAKLLQVLQDHSFQRIGGKELIKVDVRVLAATHRDLEKHIEEGQFREDLYYRINVVNIVVPPLRERKTDLFDVANVLLKKYARPGDPIPVLTPSLRDAMLAWHWPGNVRELENFVRKLLIFRECSRAECDLRALIQRRERVAGSEEWPAERQADILNPPQQASRTAAEPNGLVGMAEVERVTQRAEADAILAALNAAHWNRKVAARILSVDYKGLLYRMKKLGIEQPRAARTSDSSDGSVPPLAMSSKRGSSDSVPQTARARAAS